MTQQTTIKKSNLELMAILRPYYQKNAGLLARDLFCASLTTVCDIVLPLILSRITDTASRDMANLTVTFIGKMSALYIILRLVEIAARYFMQGTGHIMGAKIEMDMRSDMYRHLQTLPHAYFSTHKTGHIMSNLTNDLFDVTEFSHHCPEEYFIGVIKLLASFIILIRVDVLLTLILFALIPLYFYVSAKFRHRLRQAQMDQRRKIGDINASIEDSFLGFSVVKSFSNEDVEEEKFEKDNSSFLKIKKEFYYAMAAFQSVSRIFDGLMMVVVLIFGGLSLVWARISPGEFVAYILYTQTLLVTLARIIEFTEQFQRGMTGLERFDGVMSTRSDIQEKEGAVDLRNVRGKLDFDRVSFVYPNANEAVIDQLNLIIQPGHQLAIVGPSGGGKTTLTNLIPRFYDVTSGAIRIDGHDIRDLTLSSLRNNIGIVQQDVYLFSDTVGANIAYGKPGASYEEVVRAAKLAGAYDFIMDLPDGFDSYVGERGVMLSGGQKQRISIARVFLKNPPILILDEATSALDNQSERFIQESLVRLSKDRTTLIIAHRLSTIRDAEEIIVLSEGKILERGNHQDLMAAHGAYYDLYQGGMDEDEEEKAWI
ncbi:ABC transporter ATP-binding protein [Kallipyga gabonensis]|uniref:ABC transporter ATP-binding protein n=1 Tax=Kallipyga gabonensis TaxID=1686287 RepID=UPI0006B51A3B|nr:ABC transporter ATP-binding protein [Kallipyga gabonensis]